jgi:ribosomal-protein-alanine N-acetyltransferase
MTIDDVPNVCALDRKSFSLPWTENSFKYEISENTLSIPLVAESDTPAGKSIIGFIVVWIIVDEAHIGTIAVAESFQNMGVAQKLIAEAFRKARRSGTVIGYLEVRAGNIAARHLYEKLGFEVDGVRKGYYQDNHEDAILMSIKDLSRYE